MSSFNSLPIVSKEIALVPAVLSHSPVSSNNNNHGRNCSFATMMSRKPLTLGQLVDTHQPKPIPRPIWTKNPLSDKILLPFADSCRDDEVSSQQGEDKNITKTNRENSPERVDWNNNNNENKKQQRKVSPTTLEGTRRRSPIHSVQDEIKFGRRSKNSGALVLFESANSKINTNNNDDPEFTFQGKPRAEIHPHSDADKEWGFQVLDSSIYKPKNLLSLSTAEGKTNHAMHGATARPLPISLTREAVMHMHRTGADLASASKQNKISHSARTAGGNPVFRVDKMQLFDDVSSSASDANNDTEAIAYVVETKKSERGLIVRGDPVEGKNPDVLPITRKHKNALPEVDGGKFKGTNTRSVMNHLRLSLENGDENESKNKKNSPNRKSRAVVDLLNNDHLVKSAPRCSPRGENVAARKNEIFLIQPHMKKDPPLLSSRIGAPPKKIVENSLCVSKETCGSRQAFLYKLGDVGRN